MSNSKRTGGCKSTMAWYTCWITESLRKRWTGTTTKTKSPPAHKTDKQNTGHGVEEVMWEEALGGDEGGVRGERNPTNTKHTECVYEVLKE